jgi:hypothetical protein
VYTNRYRASTETRVPTHTGRRREFLAEAPAGEDTYVGCSVCGYAAHIETLVPLPNTRQLGGQSD